MKKYLNCKKSQRHKKWTYLNLRLVKMIYYWIFCNTNKVKEDINNKSMISYLKIIMKIVTHLFGQKNKQTKFNQ